MRPCGSVLACRMSGALGSTPNIEWNKHKGYCCLSCHALTDRPSLKEERLRWVLPEELQSPLPRFTSPETGWASIAWPVRSTGSDPIGSHKEGQLLSGSCVLLRSDLYTPSVQQMAARCLDTAALPGLHGHCKNIVVRRAQLELLVLVSAQNGCWEPNACPLQEKQMSL